MKLRDGLPVEVPPHDPLNDQRKDALRANELAMISGGNSTATADVASKRLDFHSSSRVESFYKVPERIIELSVAKTLWPMVTHAFHSAFSLRRAKWQRY